MITVSEKIKFNLQRDLMNHILTLDTMFFEVNSPGNIMARVLGDTNSVKTIWTDYISLGSRELIKIRSFA